MHRFTSVSRRYYSCYLQSDEDCSTYSKLEINRDKVPWPITILCNWIRQERLCKRMKSFVKITGTTRIQVTATEITRSVIISIINLNNTGITRQRENVMAIC
jgi:hypothetical protein